MTDVDLVRRGREMASQCQDDSAPLLLEMANRLELLSGLLCAFQDEMFSIGYGLTPKFIETATRHQKKRESPLVQLLDKLEETGPIGHSALLQKVKFKMKASDLKAAVDAAVAMGKVKVTNIASRSGPPRKIYSLIADA